MDPVIFIKGPNTAGANPMVAAFPNFSASPEAYPPFCIPTSMAMVRLSLSPNLKRRPNQ